MSIQRLLVANRGEIARRVFATCRRLGIETVAVHSDADAGLPFVAEADFAVHLPGSTPAETYLDGPALIAAAQHHGADAIHPGYGFLSENADFARAVEAAGLTWVGPTPTSIDAMGSKIEAKRLMREAGVPTLEAPEHPAEADLPLLVKASAGGGGRGMRVVRRLEDLASEIAAAEAEAASAFGDGTVFVEPYVERSRHVEVQVVGDGQGRVLVLGERDCSVQRRHQKVVEEAPAPGLADEVVAALHSAARRAAEAISYRGAGTVEFLYDPDTEKFFFLEMNTRLQVEHPVTEAVTGLDLVELQIDVAEGRALDVVVPGPRGHAIEVRLYAEDPTNDYRPQSGTLTSIDFPDATVEFEVQHRHGVRVDSGFAAGSEVSTHYDAMLAKVIAWGPSREQATRRLVSVLRRARIHGLTTNRDQLLAILQDPRFVDGAMTTAMLDQPVAAPRGADRGAATLAATAALVADLASRRTVQRGVPAGWRNVVSRPHVAWWDVGHPEPLDIEWLGHRDGGVGFPSADFDVRSIRAVDGGWRVDFVWEGVGSHHLVTFGPGLTGHRTVDVDGPLGAVSLREVPRFTDPADAVASGSLLAPMPGTVVKVAVADGQDVAAGDVVLVLEAMKMQHSVTAPSAGTVTVNVTTGQQVASGEVLAVVEGEDA
jgi:propionyl-CoA carboxylase alpha chain